MVLGIVGPGGRHVPPFGRSREGAPARSFPTYAHIVVDEAQDLTPMQARALARRCPSGSMTILGDLAQASGAHSYRSWREPVSLLTAGSAWTVEVLRTGFRLPPEVAEFPVTWPFIIPLIDFCGPPPRTPR